MSHRFSTRDVVGTLFVVMGSMGAIVWAIWRGGVAHQVMHGSRSHLPELHADPSAPFALPQGDTEVGRGIVGGLLSFLDLPSVALLAASFVVTIVGLLICLQPTTLAPVFLAHVATIVILAPIVIVVTGLIHPDAPPPAVDRSAERVASFETWAESRYGIEVDARTLDDLEPGATFEVRDGRVIETETVHSTDGVTSTSGLVLVEDGEELPVSEGT